MTNPPQNSGKFEIISEEKNKNKINRWMLPVVYVITSNPDMSLKERSAWLELAWKIAEAKSKTDKEQLLKKAKSSSYFPWFKSSTASSQEIRKRLTTAIEENPNESWSFKRPTPAIVF